MHDLTSLPTIGKWTYLFIFLFIFLFACMLFHWFFGCCLIIYAIVRSSWSNYIIMAIRHCYFITNLTCDELIMNIVWSLFIQVSSYILHTNTMRWKYVWYVDKCADGWSMNLWMNKCYTYFASSNKFMSQTCFQCTILMCDMYKLWMNKFCMNSITKSWDVKFVTKSW
jgi:hypothetical protein